MQKITTVFFDCYNVLCTPPLFGWVKKYLPADFTYTSDILEMIVKYDLGDVPEEEILRLLCVYEGKQRSLEEIKEEVREGGIVLEDALIIAKALKEKGFRVGLLSNGNREFFDRKTFAERPDFKDLFDPLIISSDVHIVKPDAAIFTYALETANAVAQETLFIDDSLVNIEASIALGIHGVLYTTPEKLVEDLKQYDIYI